MRIGIITLPLHTNYGGILQAYALQTVLERMGHEVKVIEKREPFSSPVFPTSIWVYFKRFIKKYIFKKDEFIFSEHIKRKAFPIMCTYTKLFCDKYIHRKFYKSLNKIKEDEYDAFIVGSDQIWRPYYFSPFLNVFLDFTYGWNVRRLAYAASFGTDKWQYPRSLEIKCKKLLNCFNGISVREKSAVTLCEEHFGKKAEWVLDPTLLLTKSDYLKLCGEIGENCNNSGKGIVCYILDDSPHKKEIITMAMKEMGLPAFYTNAKTENWHAPVEERIQPPVEEWIKSFQEAQFVITDSFHACVFSILFNRPFIFLGNVERGNARVISLLSMLGIEDRIVNSCEEMKALLPNDLDFNKMESILSERRKLSINYIERSLYA